MCQVMTACVTSCSWAGVQRQRGGPRAASQAGGTVSSMGPPQSAQATAAPPAAVGRGPSFGNLASLDFANFLAN